MNEFHRKLDSRIGTVEVTLDARKDDLNHLRGLLSQVEQAGGERKIEIVREFEATLSQMRLGLRSIEKSLESLMEDSKEYISPNKDLLQGEVDAMARSKVPAVPRC